MAEIIINERTYAAFVSVEGADDYLAADFIRAPDWIERSDPDKGRAIVTATRVLLTMPWTIVPDMTSPPDAVAQVNALLAADLANNPELVSNPSGATNVKQAKAGSAMVTFIRPIDAPPPLPAELWGILVTAGLVGGDNSIAPYVGFPPICYPVINCCDPDISVYNNCGPVYPCR